jgi:hypothetical protein
MIEKNLEIRDKFINKLIIKIKNLNNDIILLSKVDEKICENIINQKGGTTIIDNINQGFFHIIDIKERLNKNNILIKAYNDLLKQRYSQFINFFTVLSDLINSLKISHTKVDIPTFQGINIDDMKILSKLTKSQNLQDSLDNPEYQDVINKIGRDKVIQFITSRKDIPISTPVSTPISTPRSTPRSLMRQNQKTDELVSPPIEENVIDKQFNINMNNFVDKIIINYDIVRIKSNIKKEIIPTMNALKDEAANYFDELKNVDLNSDRTKDKIIAYINKQIRIIYKNLTEIDIKLVDRIKELITISFTDILKIKTNSDTLDEQFKKNINQLIQNIKQNINQFIQDIKDKKI